MRRAAVHHKLFEQSELQCAGRAFPNEATAALDALGGYGLACKTPVCLMGAVVSKTRPQPPQRPDHGVAGRKRKLL
jgi:hypothetical protein